MEVANKPLSGPYKYPANIASGEAGNNNNVARIKTPANKASPSDPIAFSLAISSSVIVGSIQFLSRRYSFITALSAIRSQDKYVVVTM